MFLKTVTKSLDSKIRGDVVYTDIHKAFDKVCNELLLHLRKCSCRRQSASDGNPSSVEYSANSGVP